MEVPSTKIMPFILKKIIGAEIGQHVGFPKPFCRDRGGDKSSGQPKPPVASSWGAPYLPQPSLPAHPRCTEVSAIPQQLRKSQIPAPARPSPRQSKAHTPHIPSPSSFLGLNHTVLPSEVEQQGAEPGWSGDLTSGQCL